MKFLKGMLLVSVFSLFSAAMAMDQQLEDNSTSVVRTIVIDDSSVSDQNHLLHIHRAILYPDSPLFVKHKTDTLNMFDIALPDPQTDVLLEKLRTSLNNSLTARPAGIENFLEPVSKMSQELYNAAIKSQTFELEHSIQWNNINNELNNFIEQQLNSLSNYYDRGLSAYYLDLWRYACTGDMVTFGKIQQNHLTSCYLPVVEKDYNLAARSALSRMANISLVYSSALIPEEIYSLRQVLSHYQSPILIMGNETGFPFNYEDTLSTYNTFYRKVCPKLF